MDKKDMQPIGPDNTFAQRRVFVAFMAAGLLLGLLTLFLTPSAGLPLPQCTFHSITGHSCLTCGMTRSLHAIAHGDLSASLRCHLFGPAVFLGMVLYFGFLIAELILGRKLEMPIGKRIRNRAFLLFGAGWIAYWGFRIAAELGAA